MIEFNHLLNLESPYIIKLLGSCLIGSRGTFHYWVEFMDRGEFHPSAYHRESWHRRLHLAKQLVAIMRYLEDSPIGGVLMMDFKTSQFLVNSNFTVKLSDLDTIRVVPVGDGLDRGKPCKSDSDCATYAWKTPEWKCVPLPPAAPSTPRQDPPLSLSKPSSALDNNSTLPTHGCKGYSTLSNMFHTCKIFLRSLLSSPPPDNMSLLQELLSRCSEAEISASDALILLNRMSS